MSRPPRIVVAVQTDADDEVRRRAEELAERLNLPIAGDAWRENADFALIYDDDILALHDAKTPHSRGVAVSLRSIPVRHGRVAISRRQPLGRAFGPKARTIVDATAGLGKDAIFLACMGFDVTAVERSPIIAALLRNGLERAMQDGRLRNAIEDRLRVVCTDAREYLKSIEQKPDSVYIDPMFPPKRKKSALAKKSIRLVRSIVGDDVDAMGLVETALRIARDRVVVKRPDDAPPLMPRPMASFPGKLVRYDVYHAGAPVPQSQLHIER